MHVDFDCPACEHPARARLDRADDWQCPGCEHRLHLDAAEPTLPHCPVCGNAELYKQKDFPHWLGMTILVTACVASVITYYLYEPWLTWAILIGSAAFDGLLYLWVGDAVVCYRCGARCKGFTPTEAHKPHELTVAERYRQERIRREQARATTGSVPRP